MRSMIPRLACVLDGETCFSQQLLPDQDKLYDAVHAISEVAEDWVHKGMLQWRVKA